MQFSSKENKILENFNLKTIASILKCLPVQQKFLYIPAIIESLTQTVANHQEIYAKLIQIVKNISNEFEFCSLQCLSSKEYKKAGKDIFSVTYETPSLYSLYFKQMQKKKLACIHPSVATRKADKKWFPDIESF